MEVEVAGYCMLRNSAFYTISSIGYKKERKKKKKKWTGHVVSMKHRRSLYIVLVENTDLKRAWNMDLYKIVWEAVESIHPVQDISNCTLL